MKNYDVVCDARFGITISAETEEEAIEIAQRDFGGTSATVMVGGGAFADVAIAPFDDSDWSAREI